jgi:TetR/AcrR family transcriptional repressor of bet genes
MPKRVDVQLQRRTISSAAISAISHSGLDRVRLEDVAKAAKVTTGAVTHYFASKDEVLEAALAEIVERTLSRMGQGGEVRPRDERALVRRVCAYLPVDDEARAEWRVWLAFWGRAISDARLRAVHADYYARFVDRLAITLMKFLNKPSARRSDEFVELADSVIAALDGVGTRATLEPEAWPAARQKRTLQRTLLPLLRAAARDTTKDR